MGNRVLCLDRDVTLLAWSLMPYDKTLQSSVLRQSWRSVRLESRLQRDFWWEQRQEFVTSSLRSRAVVLCKSIFLWEEQGGIQCCCYVDRLNSVQPKLLLLNSFPDHLWILDPPFGFVATPIRITQVFTGIL